MKKKFYAPGRWLTLLLVLLWYASPAQDIRSRAALQKDAQQHAHEHAAKINPADRCATVEYMKQLRERYSSMMSDDEFERWIAPKVEALRAAKRRQTYSSTTYTIPVVVHIIHQGQAVGTGNNIPYDQVLSQIRVLNEDFNRLNADAANTPAVFLPVASSISIEFKLATRDPNGQPLPEPGVNRVNAVANGWGNGPYSTNFINSTIKPNTIWDPNRYFNIWVCPIAGNVLGYAQFPDGSTLPGIPLPVGPANTDGVVTNTGAFGSNYDANGNPIANPFNLFTGYDRGRTTTHEVGHFLGLRHIWGDGDCSVDDFVADTPLAGQSNFTNAPCTFPGPNSCNEGPGDLPDMFQNYMDYSYDVCMNLFTQGQVDRMEVVLANSPRRVDLLTSDAADPLDIFAGFMAAPMSGCAPLEVTFTDQSGVAEDEPPINSWTWNFDLNNTGGAVTPSTATGQGPHTVTFDPSSLGPGTYTYTVELTVSNGVNTATFTRDITVLVLAPPQPLPLANGFEGATVSGNGIINGWTVSTTDAQGRGWETTTLAAIEGTQSLRVENVNANLSGQTVELVSPPIDLTSTSIPSLRFQVAYAAYSSSFFDGLRILVIDPCTGQQTVVYDKAGAALATAPNTTSSFIPNSSQWRLETVDLSQFAGQSGLRIVFRNIGGFGNHLYIDDVRIEEPAIDPAFNLSVSEGCAPLTVEFTDASQVGFNQPPINSWTWNFDLNNTGGAVTPSTATGQGPHTVTFDPSSLGPGTYTYTVELTVDNGNGTATTTRQVSVLVPEAPAALPQYNGFEGTQTITGGNGVINGWLAVSTANNGWEVSTAAIEGSRSLRVNNYSFNLTNQTVELITPPLDFSNLNAAALRFFVAYRVFGNIQNEGLRIVMRDPCTGNETEVFAKYGSDLETSPGTPAFIPTSPSEWREEVVDLSQFAGQSGLQLVFQNIGRFGNNLYIDDVRIEEPAEVDMAIVDGLPKAWALVWDGVNFVAQVENNGSTAVTDFDIEVEVEDAGGNTVFSQTESISLSDPINFTERRRLVLPFTWTPTATGTYTVSISVQIANDADASNDVFTFPLTVIDPKYTGGIYAYNAFSTSTPSLQDHYVKVNIATGTQSGIAPSAGPADIFGGDMVNDVVMGVSADGKLYLIDEAGNEYLLAELSRGNIYTGLTHDGSDLYVSYTTTGLNVELSRIGSDFSEEPIGLIGNALGIIGIAANSAGELYGISIVDDKLYRIDKTTAAPTEVGPLGVDINFVQDIGFDKINDVLYGTLYLAANVGGLYVIDLSTGEASRVGDGFGNEELTMCAVYAIYDLTFVVSSSAGGPVAGATITINNQTLTTDANGEATIQLLNGTYTYEVSAANHESASGTVVINNDNVTEQVTLTRLYDLTFVVSSSAGGPVAGVTITINNQTLTTDANGEATIQLLNGTYSYSVNAGADFNPVPDGQVVIENADESISIVLVRNPLGVEDLSRLGIELYPNPVESYLTLRVQESAVVRIIDMQGKVLVQLEAGSADQRIDMRAYQKGMYLIEINTRDGRRHIGRILKH